MVRSIKLTDNTYWNSDGVSYDNKELTEVLNNIGTIYNTTKSNIYCKTNSSTQLCSLTLPPGLYVLIGSFDWHSNQLSYYFTVGDRSLSAYDNEGYVSGTVSTIVGSLTSNTTVASYMWPRNQDITLFGASLKAIRIK